jgi:hypothetical protein
MAACLGFLRISLNIRGHSKPLPLQPTLTWHIIGRFVELSLSQLREIPLRRSYASLTRKPFAQFLVFGQVGVALEKPW